MSIEFRCEHCRKTVTAPDSAGGKRGKCPFCGESSYIPLPKGEEEGEIPLAPLDEEEERLREQRVHELIRQDPVVRDDPKDAEPSVPLEFKEDLASNDLHHYVVNYCMDMFRGNLDRARQHVQQLAKFQRTAIAAVEDFESGKVMEQSLDLIPRKVLQGFLNSLKRELKV